MDTVPERVKPRTREVARWLSPLAVVVVVGAIYFPLTTRFLQGQGDFANHIERAENLTRGVLDVPHILFHTLVAAGIVGGADARDAALVVTLSLQIAASLAVLWYLRVYTTAGPIVATVLAILVLAAGPVTTPADRGLFMLGYFLPNAIHNPTVIAGKVFIPFLLAIGTSAIGWTTRPWIRGSMAAPMVVLAGLAKPHYVSCVTAAAAAASAVRALNGGDVRWRLLGIGLGVPSAAVLGWAQFGTIEFAGGGTAILAPLAVLGRYVPVDLASMLQRLASDIAFPLSVAVLWPATVVRFPPLMLGWAAYGVGLGQALLLAESGSRMFDGNFLWSGHMATFGLMTASAACLAEESSGGRFGCRSVVAWTILLVHVAFWSWWAVHRLNS
jgi:hypothetical protein